MAYSLTLGAISFFLAVIWGRPLIALLKRLGLGKRIRINGPETHMVVITTVLNIMNFLGRTLIGRSILVPMGVMIAFGVLGAVDDLAGVRGDRQDQGLLPRRKFFWQTGIAFATAAALYFGLDLHSVAFPGIPEKVDIGLWYIPIAMFIIVGTSNAVNLTDGLDGLAGSIAALAFACYGVIAYLQGQVWLVAFCFTVVGALLAFLWYNAYPAQLYMGDTGSLALGATLAVIALMTGQWLLLPVVGLVFVAEAMSVILQVVYFKLTGGKRLFKMSPLHHHFELLGWSETHVTQRFWLIGVLSGMLGIALALV